MADSLYNILSQKDFDEPAELIAVKAYIKRHFDEEITVKMSGKDVVVFAPNASFAGALRMQSNKVKQECGLEGRLTIRIRN